jgi:hypothetical protein
VLLGVAAAALGAWLIGLAMIHGQWAGVGLVTLLSGFFAGPLLGVAFYVKMAFDGDRLIYKSVHPWAVLKVDVASLEVKRFGEVSTMGLPILRLVDDSGTTLRSATCVWSDRQISEIAAALGVRERKA